MDKLFDKRTKCWSVQTTMSVGEYLALVKAAHQERGAVEGQRDVLTTTTAKRIRSRMISDLKSGALLPPVVIGAVVDEEKLKEIDKEEFSSVDDFLTEDGRASLSIIDGMQRTAALMEAVREEPSVKAALMRVEFWITASVRAMVYRMLVLNTGQVPWTISRQLSVVYAPLLREIMTNVPDLDKVSTPDSPGRRVAGGQYTSDALIELYIAFSLRKTAVDTKEAVSDEFSRLDFVENLSESSFQEQFYTALRMLARLDKAFSEYQGDGEGRFSKGRAIFDAQPARIGYIVALGNAVLGRPGMNREQSEREARMAELQESQERLLVRLGSMSPEALGDFLRLDVLQEVLDRRVGQVGRYERGVFSEAFKVLVDEAFSLDNMEPCWRAG